MEHKAITIKLNQETGSEKKTDLNTKLMLETLVYSFKVITK